MVCCELRWQAASRVARNSAHGLRHPPVSTAAPRRLSPQAGLVRQSAARAEGDGYKRAPFLEPFVATVATAVLVMAFASPGVLQVFQQQAQAKSPTADGSPYSDAKTISFGVLNGCAAAGMSAHIAEPLRMRALRSAPADVRSTSQSVSRRH